MLRRKRAPGPRDLNTDLTEEGNRTLYLRLKDCGATIIERFSETHAPLPWSPVEADRRISWVSQDLEYDVLSRSYVARYRGIERLSSTGVERIVIIPDTLLMVHAIRVEDALTILVKAHVGAVHYRDSTKEEPGKGKSRKRAVESQDGDEDDEDEEEFWA